MYSLFSVLTFYTRTFESCAFEKAVSLCSQIWTVAATGWVVVTIKTINFTATNSLHNIHSRNNSSLVIHIEFSFYSSLSSLSQETVAVVLVFCRLIPFRIPLLDTDSRMLVPNDALYDRLKYLKQRNWWVVLNHFQDLWVAWFYSGLGVIWKTYRYFFLWSAIRRKSEHLNGKMDGNTALCRWWRITPSALSHKLKKAVTKW